MARRPPIRALVFDAGHTLLEMDYARLTAYLVSRGHDLGEAAVTGAERRARIRLDVEREAQATRGRTGGGTLRPLSGGLSRNRGRRGTDRDRRMAARLQRPDRAVPPGRRRTGEGPSACA